MIFSPYLSPKNATSPTSRVPGLRSSMRPSTQPPRDTAVPWRANCDYRDISLGELRRIERRDLSIEQVVDGDVHLLLDQDLRILQRRLRAASMIEDDQVDALLFGSP